MLLILSLHFLYFLFLSNHNDFCLSLIFKDSNLFGFTNFPFKTKYDDTVVDPVSSRRKQEKKLLKQFFD